MKATNILLLGESDVGKTHFGGQLLGRLAQEQGALRMMGSPQSLTAFEEVLGALNKGLSAEHTAFEQYHESRWPITDLQGRHIELVWPDYGGEQIRQIREKRSMSPEWRKRVIESEAWIIMVRIQHSELSDDIFSRPLAGLINAPKADATFAMSPQARLIEFLQWLMYVRATGTLAPVSEPRLMLLLSCWDELPEEQQSRPPAEILASRMPLVSAFVGANWAPRAVRTLGLSALERPLSKDAPDQDYIDQGPENFGYMVREDGQRDKDLTLAIAPLV